MFDQVDFLTDGLLLMAAAVLTVSAVSLLSDLLLDVLTYLRELSMWQSTPFA